MTLEDTLRMQTTHLKGKQLAWFDAALSERLMLKPANERSVGRTTLRIGIRNECGELYRVIGTSKPAEFMMTVDRLEALGFVREPDSTMDSAQFHAVMRPSQLLPDADDVGV
jgi:predicted lysophospholipase L1 biosynthesis ABC-type transport system permease subunit